MMTAMTAVSVCPGAALPAAGAVVGRVAERVSAHTIGVLAVYRLLTVAVVAIVPVSIAIAVSLAVLPARRAARLRPASILRSE